jgi:hypothetical protein
MFCTNCGKPLPPESGFCPSCGAAQSSFNSPQPLAGSQPVQAASAVTGKHRRIRVILAIGVPIVVLALVGGLFLGGILPNPFNTGTTDEPRTTTVKPTAKPTRKPTAAATSTTIATSTEATTEVTTTAPTEATTLATSPPLPVELAVSDVLDYFEEIALKREYGSGEFDGVVCRWQEPVYIQINGEYTVDDYNFLIAHVNYLNSLDGLPELSVVADGGNFQVHFSRLDQLADVVPGYVEGNWGFISIDWDSQGQVYYANMGIATDVTSQVQRNHLILEEMTQGLGMLNDSTLYPDSIFQADWTETQSISALDEWIIRLLYSPAIEAGMKEGVRDLLTDWLLNG